MLLIRSIASNDFEKGFFKLMSNGVFSQTKENIRNRRNMDLVTSDRKLRKLASVHVTGLNKSLFLVWRRDFEDSRETILQKLVDLSCIL